MKLQLMCSHKFWEGCGYVTTTVLVIFYYKIACFLANADNKTDLVTVFDAVLTSRQMCEKLYCLYENLMSNNFRKTAVLKKISIVN